MHGHSPFLLRSLLVSGRAMPWTTTTTLATPWYLQCFLRRSQQVLLPYRLRSGGLWLQCYFGMGVASKAFFGPIDSHFYPFA